jgi:hypothetical protein
MPMKKTFLGTTAIIAAFSGIVVLFKSFPATQGIVHNSVFVLLIGMYAIALLTGYISHKGTNASPEMGVAWFLGTNVLRILLCTMLVGVLLFQGVGQRGILILNFFIIYVILLVFEVWLMVGELNKKQL